MWPQLRLPVLNLPCRKPLIWFIIYLLLFKKLGKSTHDGSHLSYHQFYYCFVERLGRRARVTFYFTFVFEKIKRRVYIYGLVQWGTSFIFSDSLIPRRTASCRMRDGPGSPLTHVYRLYIVHLCTHKIIIYTVQRTSSGDERQYYVASCSDLNGRLCWKRVKDKGEVWGILLLYDLSLWKRRPKIPLDLYRYLLPFCLF